MTILVTRPEPGASRTVAALEARGLAALSCPLFNIVPSGMPRPTGKFAALLVTSWHGADGLTPEAADLPANLPVFAVGDRTAEAMTANGFSNVVSASGDQKALTRLVLARLKPRYRVLLATGEDHKEGLPAAFAEAGYEIALWVRYRAEAVHEMPGAAREALAEGSVTQGLHFSRRASETFLALAEKAGLGNKLAPLKHVALSADVAEPLRAAGLQHVVVARQPDEEHLLALVAGSDGPAEIVPPAAIPETPEIIAPNASEKLIPRSRRLTPTDAAPTAEAAADIHTTGSVTAPETEPAPEPFLLRESPVAEETLQGPAPEPVAAASRMPDTPPPVRPGFGIGAVAVSALASGVIGAGLMGYLAPRLGLQPPPPAVTDVTARLARLESARPAQGAPDVQAAIQSALQNAPVPPQVHEQISGLERRLGELAARPQAPASGVAEAALTELRDKLAAAEQAAQALAPRLAEVEKVARTVGTPSASASAAAKLILADRLSRAISEGRPFAAELSALSALGAAAEPMGVLTPMAAAGAPALAAITAEFRKLRPVFAAEPASPDAPLSERLLRLTDGLVRVRSTGAVQGASPAAIASRIDQALQRGDSAAAVSAFADLPEPARRAGEAWIATLRQRASADQAIKTITDDAIAALSAQK